MPRFSSRLRTAVLTLALVLVAQRLQEPPPIPVTEPLPSSQQIPTPVDSPQQSTAIPVSVSEPQKNDTQTAPSEKQTSQRPQVAIIIDDMGYNLDIGQQLLQLDLSLSFSFLPSAPHTGELTRQAKNWGRSILVHLPLEPKTWQGNEEQETLRVGENEEALQEKLKGMLAAVPTAVGANNHMGSRFTEDRKRMQLVLAGLQARSMFYIDSFTSAASVGETTAQQMGLPTARRTVFLDNQQQPAAICRQLGLLATKATAEGSAIAIGHPNLAMVEALRTCAGERLRSVQLVGVERLVH